MLSDGTEIRGVLHRTQGTRTLDYLNHQAEAFVAMTDAMLYSGERTENVAFIAINKAHIVRLIEAGDFTAYPDALRFVIAVKVATA